MLVLNHQSLHIIWLHFGTNLAANFNDPSTIGGEVGNYIADDSCKMKIPVKLTTINKALPGDTPEFLSLYSLKQILVFSIVLPSGIFGP